jgi:hypothetical protein
MRPRPRWKGVAGETVGEGQLLRGERRRRRQGLEVVMVAIVVEMVAGMCWIHLLLVRHMAL